MSNAVAGVGAEFRRGDGASNEQFTALAEVKNITGPGLTRDFIDVTNLGSTGGWREFITGFRNGGEYTFTMNFIRSDFDLLYGDFNSDDSRNYQVGLPDDDTTDITFAGFVTELPMNIVPDDAITVAVTIKITGEPDIPS